MGRSRSRAGLFAFMFVVSAAPSLYGALTSPTTFDYWKDRFWTPSLKAVPLRNAYVDSGGSTHVALVVTGEIGRASAATLSAAIDRAGLVVGDAVVLSSPGGDLDQALIMGEEIRRRGLLTVVGSYATGAFAPSYCASACVAVFAGGVHRIQARGSRMGVHQFATVGTTPDDPVAYAQRETGDLMAYFTRMGVDAMVVQAGSGSREMRWLTPDEVTRLRLSDFDVDTM